MAQPGDIVLQDGIWYEITSISGSDIGGERLNPTIQSYLNERYEGVRGEGANQVFVPFDDPDILSTGPVPRASVLRSIDNLTATGTSTTSTGNQSGNMTDLYRQFVNDPEAIYPPQYTSVDKETGERVPTGIVQADMMKAFISWGKAGNYFTDADVANSSSSVVVEKGADGIDRTFIRQPDGTLDFVPDVKTSAADAPAATYEYDENFGRFVAKNEAGEIIDFGPEQRGDATTGTDETGRRFVTQPDGTRQYLDREYTPGVVSQGGYNLLQQPTGALSQLAPLPEPAGVETVGGMQFIRTSTGELMPLDNVMNRMMENMVVTGDLEGAAAIHAWQTRPSNQEYFDRALAYMRSPADQLVISAIARGQGLVSPPPEETIQRIGPQPDYLTDAFKMLQDQMQMGMPEGTQTFANTLAERAQAIELEAAELALERQREENNQLAISNSLNNEAAAIANEGASIANQTAVVTATDNHTSAVLNQDAADINNSIAASALTGDDGNDQDDVLVSDEKDPEPVVAETAPDPATAPTYAPSEEDTYVAPEVEQLSFQEAVAQIQEESPGSGATVFSQPDPEPMPAPTYAPPEEAAPITTAEALSSFGVAPSQMSSYTGTTPASTPASAPASPDPFATRGRAGGGMVGKKEMTMVGESGPELALFPHGTEIIPLDRQMQPSQVQRLRNRGVRGMQEGGIVFDSPLPLGIRQLQAGRSLGAPRGQLLRTAGIALPSAQARRRMLPGEREAFGNWDG
jgi:hypothetical protein